MRTALHVLVSVVLWGVFLYYWDIVSHGAVGRGTILAIQVLTGLIVAGTLFTGWWILHNKRLGRRNRRRAAPPARAETFDHDALGRVIQGPGLEVLRAAAAVEIAVVAEQKVYSVAPPATGAGGG